MSKYLLEDMVKIKRVNKELKKEVIKELGKENSSKNKSRYLLWLVAFVSFAFLLFALSFLFGKAEIQVNPKTKDVTLNENLSATRDSNVNGIFFNLMGPIFGEENKTVVATGQKDVAEKATGVIVLYNAFGYFPQSLNVDTRLEGSNGKIYKTQIKTIVPGMSKANVPGSVEVNIYGTEAGVEYNSAPLDFKILGFKGTSKYSKIYGRSKGEITGGFVGKAPDVSDADRLVAISDLKSTLQANLLQKATDLIPAGSVLFKDAIFLNADDSNITSSYNKDNSVTFTIKGTFYGLLFNEQKLTQKIAQDNIDKYDGSDVFIPNIRDLTFSLTNKDNISFDNLQNINFNLSGSTKIAWKLDVNKFTADLLGKSKKDFTQILLQYPNVDSATLTLSPFWKMSIPNKTKDINVIVNYPQ
jgi:hypothetical protein